jgi:hypothetical protein
MIDIQKLIKDTDKSFDDIAHALFPTNKYPTRALKRVIDKKTELKQDQIVKLAELLRMSIDDIFHNRTWKVDPRDPYILCKGPYKAVLVLPLRSEDEDRVVINVYDGVELKETLYARQSNKLSDFINLLNENIDVD